MAAPLIVITGATHGMAVRSRLRSRVNTARCSAIPDFIAPERIAEIILFCYKLPQSICIRDLVVMPTTSGY